MTTPGHLRYDNKTFPLEQATFYGIYESRGYMSWWIELFPRGEDNYIMFNSLIFSNIFLPQQFNFLNSADIGDKYEHTVRVNGGDRFLESANLTFRRWDVKTQSIQLTGEGTISGERMEGLPEVHYEFNANLTCTGIHIFETTKEDAQKFVDMHLKNELDIDFEVKFEEVPSGLTATIVGRF
jgi:hypothetical protein